MFGFCLGLRADYFFSPPFSPLLFPSFFLTTKSFHSKNVQFLVKWAPPLPNPKQKDALFSKVVPSPPQPET